MGTVRAKSLSKENIFLFVVFSIFCFSLTFLIGESLERVFFLGFTLLLWAVIFFYTKNLILSSLLYILIVLPFNVTLQLPLVVEIFNTNLTLSQPFTEGIYVNYLVPTLSVIDIALFLSLASILIVKGVSFYMDIFKSFKNALLPFLIFLLIQNIFLQNLNSAIISLRIFSVLLLLIILIEEYGKRFRNQIFRRKVLITIGYIFLINIFFQGILGIIQFSRGSSLGVFFLGESKVVSGMMGSSFIELSNQLFLRAYGTFSHPNILAAYFLLAIFIGMLVFKHKESLGLLLIFLSKFFLLVTFSRIGIFLALIAVIGFLLREIFTKRVKPWEHFSFTPLLFFERFTNLFTGGDVSWSERSELLERSLRVFRENWIFGVGGGSFVKAMEGFVPRTSRGILLLQPVHNIFLLLLSEFGIVGFVLFFWILLRIIVRNIGEVTVLKGLVLFSLFVMGIFDHFLISLPQGIILFLLFLLLLCFDLEGLKDNEKDVNKN